jgi:AraC-like DNA-binding protein
VLAAAHFTRTCREWFDDILTYWAYHTNAFTFEIVEDFEPGKSLVREKNFLVGHKSRQYSEHVIANIVGLARRGTDRPEANALEIRFRHSRPSDVSTHEAFFRCPIRFGCEHDEIVFPTAMLDYPTHGRLSPFRSVVRRYVQARIDRLEFYDVGVATNVALTITSLTGTGHTGLAAIAEAMELSPKKLQRLLAAEGTNFSEVAESVRDKLAREHLDHPVPQVGQVASFLGYSGNAAFTLAFRKWTGMSPLQWRKSRREG